MTRFALELRYDGTHYHGWQSQDNAVTVQQTLQEAIAKIQRIEVAVTGCGRTDTGVHASHFVAHFDLTIPLIDDFLSRLNKVLPFDIAVQSIYSVPNEFNARFDAKSRTYLYHIQLVKDPFRRDYAYSYHRPLNLANMQEACTILKRHKEFGAFCKSHAQNKTNLCDIFEAGWENDQRQLVFKIKANRFLRNMVRAIVGTLIEIGENKIGIQEFESIIESQNRQHAGYSVPAKGLFLHEIEYDKSNWTIIQHR